MITSIFSQIDRIIKPFQEENQRLYQALSILAKGTDKVSEIADLSKQIDYGCSLTFELPGVRTNANDVYPTRPRLYLPRNPGNNLVATDITVFQPRLTLQYVGISAKVPLAGGGPYLPDILVSRDQGVTFNSIFKVAFPLNLIVGQVTGSNKIFAISTLLDGDLFKINETGTDGTLEGIEIYLLGNLIVQQ